MVLKPQLHTPRAPTENTYSIFLFCRLDLVPINRSVGLKAKPTKPVTEVLRPVVAKYGLHLSDLVARIVSMPHSGCLQMDRKKQTSSVRDDIKLVSRVCLFVSVSCRVGSWSHLIQVFLYPTWMGCEWCQIQQNTLLEKVGNKTTKQKMSGCIYICVLHLNSDHVCICISTCAPFPLFSRQTEGSSSLDKQKPINNSKITLSFLFPIFFFLWNVP